MAEEVTVKEKGRLKKWFSGLKAEFKKIIWPDKQSVAKSTMAVIVITIILGLVIALLDMGIKYLVNFIV